MTYNEYYFYTLLGDPLPEEVLKYREKLLEIGALDLSDVKVHSRFPDQIWQIAVTCNINLFPADLKYVESVIKKDKMFNGIHFDHVPGLSESQKHDISVKKISCLERFYNDRDCPPQLKKILDVGLAIIRGGMLPEKPKDPSLHDFVIDALVRNRNIKQSNEYETPPKKKDFATLVLEDRLKKQSHKYEINPKKPKNDFAAHVLLDKLKKQSQI